MTSTDQGLQASFTNFGEAVALTNTWGAAYSCPHPWAGEELELMFWPDADGQASHIVSRSGVAARAP